MTTISREEIEEKYAGLVLLDGLDDAILGVANRGGAQDFVVYSREKILQILQQSNDWDEEEAEEWFDFNVACAWFGDKTPAILE